MIKMKKESKKVIKEVKKNIKDYIEKFYDVQPILVQGYIDGQIISLWEFLDDMSVDIELDIRHYKSKIISKLK